MAVPKRRTSRANTRARKARWIAGARRADPGLVPITVDGERMLVPRRLVRYFHSAHSAATESGNGGGRR
ncbi:50S ribosomal protein L32 [Saccharomonospora piscinae]|uniref:50S ribosomal protein L32 n=1 Tax=Saccharomonospora piscinae TaxID=687388 RepID=UPI00110592CA|nr:50S ribosomal protein L32 [Saccharomonospora piscinae]TLW90702.1 50S ribosomal protein L32 [Saccharomonospora piscinae]